jgi:hypothetical protein
MLDEDNVYDGIAQTVQLALAENRDQEIDSSPLSKAGVKLPLPKPYLGSPKLEDFEDFMSNALHWLKINCMLGATSNELQLIFLGTRLNGEAQEWYMRNVHIIQQWNLETAILGLQCRFLPTLMHRHAASDFDVVGQGSSTVQELYNLMNKLADRMIHPPDDYTFR